jgi:hypothetical protein
LQKPVVLTTSGRTVNNINIYQYISDLTPAIDGKKNPAESGQSHWLFQTATIRFLIGKANDSAQYWPE